MTRTTQYRYNVDGLLEELVCRNGEAEQVTQWVYGVEKAGANGIARADLVREKICPGGGADRVSYAYNQLGQPVEMLDQNGTRHEYAYDALGRLTLDSLPDGPGAGVDGAIRAIERGYAVDGDLEKVTSYSDAAATTVMNEVEYVRNPFGQVIEERQAHGGGVPMAQVEYAYQSAAGGGNSARRTEVVYPASKQVDLRYDGTINDAASRLRKLVDPNTTPTETVLVSYSYLGMGTLVQQVQAGGLEMTAIKPSGQADGDAGDPYIGYDRFGRLEDARWIRDTGADRERVEFGFDRVGNKVWRRNREADSELFDESYAYDGLYQVKTLARGKLNQNRTGIGGIPQWQEGWRYDEMGNWLGYETAANGAPVLTQERSYNAGNELLFIEESNATVAHDAAGNMTRMPAVGEWNDEDPLVAQGLVWDAWNRLVKITGAAGATIAEYAYDGMHRRIWKKTGFPSSIVTRHFYYDDRWQVLEERLDASTAAERHFVWGVRGIDDLVFRDLLAAGSVTQRLWAINDGKNVTAIAIGHTVVERYIYDAFGFTRVYDADFQPKEDNESDYGWETRFSAYRWDGEPGLYQVRYRYCHAGLGRWLSRDLIEESVESRELNAFAYVANQATNKIDPVGLAMRRDGYPPGISPPEFWLYGSITITCHVALVLQRKAGALGGGCPKGVIGWGSASGKPINYPEVLSHALQKATNDALNQVPKCCEVAHHASACAVKESSRCMNSPILCLLLIFLAQYGALGETMPPSEWSLTELADTDSVFVVRWEERKGTLKATVVRSLRGELPNDLSFLDALGRVARRDAMSIVALNGNLFAPGNLLKVKSVPNDGRILIKTEAGEKVKAVTLDELAALLKPMHGR
jgi:RHS repeat-associated protein